MKPLRSLQLAPTALSDSSSSTTQDTQNGETPAIPHSGDQWLQYCNTHSRDQTTSNAPLRRSSAGAFWENINQKSVESLLKGRTDRRENELEDKRHTYMSLHYDRPSITIECSIINQENVSKSFSCSFFNREFGQVTA